MESPTYALCCEAIGLPLTLHRKNWEFAYIVQALDERGVLTPGARGLGFAVGMEPLPAFFASRGCSVLATDLAPDDEASEAWIRGGQHATSAVALNQAGLCDPDAFTRLVELRWVDMTKIDADIRGFDFAWSSCAFEHLGSLDAGLAFVRNQLECLRPGGVSVHTTELNVSSDDATLESGPAVLFRRQDIRSLARRLTAEGHTVAPITFRLGDLAGDRFVVPPPHTIDAPHLKIQVGPYVTTSFGIIVERSRA
jgi:hypothetical protein